MKTHKRMNSTLIKDVIYCNSISVVAVRCLVQKFQSPYYKTENWITKEYLGIVFHLRLSGNVCVNSSEKTNFVNSRQLSLPFVFIFVL